jgi:hypothetical protein
MAFSRVTTIGALNVVALGALLGAAALGRTVPGARAVVPEGASPTLVYAVNEYGYSVTAFRQSANGNAAPTVDISGSETKIYEPVGLAVARSGQVAVSDSGNDITLYAAGANGNVAPVGTITCGRGGDPGVPGQIAFDERGNLYAEYYGGYHAPSDAIEVYKPSEQSGCVTGKHVLFGAKTGISSFGGIAVAGGTIYNSSGNGVLEFHTSDNGNVAPFNVIEGAKTGLSQANGIAVDKNGYLYIANANDVRVFAPGASGNAKPVAVISGSNTLIPQPGSGYGALSIAAGKDGSIFVGVQYDTNVSSILVFAAGSNGNVAPEHVITGAKTGLDWVAELGIL